MAQEKVGTQRPGQTQGEYPDRSEPHPRMIMQIAGFNQFPGPVVEPVDPGTPFFGSSDRTVISKFPALQVTFCQIARPDCWSHFQPPFPVSPPENFLQKFLRRSGRMLGENMGEDFLFGNQPVTQIAGKP